MAVICENINATSERRYTKVRYNTATSAPDIVVINPENDPLALNRVIHLSRRDFESFLSTIFLDEEPNDALRHAAERYNQQFG